MCIARCFLGELPDSSRDAAAFGMGCRPYDAGSVAGCTRGAERTLRRVVCDPGVYVIGIVAIGLVAALAGFVPTRRAASADPARALPTG